MNRKLRNLLQADLFSEPAAEPSPAPEQPPARKPRYTPKRQFVAPNTDKLPTGETRQELEQRRQRIHVKAYIRELGLNYRALVECPELFRKQFSRTPAAALAKLAHVQPLYLREIYRRIIRDHCGLELDEAQVQQLEPIPGSTNPIAHLLIWEKYF